jgi:hypothetical protein
MPSMTLSSSRRIFLAIAPSRKKDLWESIAALSLRIKLRNS